MASSSLVHPATLKKTQSERVAFFVAWKGGRRTGFLPRKNPIGQAQRLLMFMADEARFAKFISERKKFIVESMKSIFNPRKK